MLSSLHRLDEKAQHPRCRALGRGHREGAGPSVTADVLPNLLPRALAEHIEYSSREACCGTTATVETV